MEPGRKYSREELAEFYLEQLPYPPYPVQEEALLAWFTNEQGVLVCAPTGTGKTLIAEGALFEALCSNTIAYYTTPLIALTEQKFQELQDAAERWGFRRNDVGLVTGNRHVNKDARVLVVVAEILLNRLLNAEMFDFHNVSTVVMDEFHSFNDPQRGIVWELSLSMLPRQVRLMLLSATVGNSREFLNWLRHSHGRNLELVESTERKIPLSYQYVEDQLLNEHMEQIAQGSVEERRTPALLFCFNRDECWNVAEQLKGLKLLGQEQRQPLLDEVNRLDWSQGVGPKLKQMLQRGVGVHHAGMLPKYRRVVEDLYVRKLLAVCVCTETLAAGLNLPARSVIMTTLLKGPRGKKKVIEPSTAHQIFGRAGRPQFDKEGFVYALAHEDDVKILRWKEKYDQIPENTKDPGLIKAKKNLKKKKPTRRETEQYWNFEQFEKLRGAPPSNLASRGQIPWRLLAYLLKTSPDVERVRTVIRKRLMDENQIQKHLQDLNQMCLTLWSAGFVELDPEPPQPKLPEGESTEEPQAEAPEPSGGGLLEGLLPETTPEEKTAKTPKPKKEKSPLEKYAPTQATPTEKLDQLLVFRSVHPLYGAFLLRHLGKGNREERLQALESVLEVPRPLLRSLRVPRPDDLPPGPLATEVLDPMMISMGHMSSAVYSDDEQEAEGAFYLPLAEKLYLLFESEFPDVTDVRVQNIWAAGDLFTFGGDFNQYVKLKDLTKQEGIVFRHFLRLILLCGEFMQVTPEGMSEEDWHAELKELSDQLTESCRAVDPTSTDETIAMAHAADVVEGETGKR